MRTRRQQRRDVNGKLKSNFIINNKNTPGGRIRKGLGKTAKASGVTA